MLDKIKWLFVKGQITKLSLKDGDILVIKPPMGKSWYSEKTQKIHELVQNALKNSGYNNSCITFVDDVNLGIIENEHFKTQSSEESLKDVEPFFTDEELQKINQRLFKENEKNKRGRK